MSIKLTQPVEGRDVGETISLDSGKEAWYVQNGYATRGDGEKDEDFGKFATSTDAEDDPTLAANREDTNADTPGVQTKTVSDSPADPTSQAASQDRTGNASGVNPDASLSTAPGSEFNKAGEAPSAITTDDSEAKLDDDGTPVSS
ncbi:MAG: hypothetical protein QOC92_4492 [Acidimicrobiaceae bacterium]|jgi:hypothetical protein